MQKVFTLSEQGIISLSNFLLAIIVARYLSIEEFGIFTLIWIVFLLINTVQQSLISNPYMTLPLRYIKSKKYKQELQTLQIHFLLLSTVLFVLIFFFLKKFYGVSSELLIATISTLILFNMHDYLRRIFFANEEYVAAFISTNIAYTGRVILVFILFESHVEMGLLEVFYLSSIFYVLSILIGLKYFYLRIPYIRSNTTIFFMKHWQSGQWLLPSRVLQWVSMNFFLLIAGLVISPVAIGILRAGQNLLNLFNILLLAGENYFPRKAKKIHEINGSKYTFLYLLKWCSIFAVIILILTPVINTMGNQILAFIYGDQYEKYGYILNYYLVLAFLSVLLTFIQIYLRVLESLKSWFQGQMIAGVFAILSAYPLISFFQLNGVLYGLVVSQIIVLLVMILNFTKKKYK